MSSSHATSNSPARRRSGRPEPAPLALGGSPALPTEAEGAFGAANRPLALLPPRFRCNGPHDPERRTRSSPMAQKGKRRADQQLLQTLASGATVEGAARQTGLSESTVYRRLRDPTFVRRLEEIHADRLQRATGAMTALLPEAVRGLLDLFKQPESPAAR